MLLFTKSVATGLLAMACAVPAAQAKTVEFTYTALIENIPGSFDALGVTAADALTFTVTLDPDATPNVVTDLSSDSPVFSFQSFFASYDYEALTLGIGSTSFAAPAAPVADSFWVRDGTDGTGNTFDDIDVVTTTDFAGPNGTVIEFASMSLNNFDETALSGIEVPTLAEVVAVGTDGQFGANLQFSLGGESLRVTSLFSQGGTLSIREVPDPDIAPIPVPAALPLMASAFGVMAVFGWRRRHC